MAYSSFTKGELKDKFGIEEIFLSGVFDEVPPRPVSDWLLSFLAENVPFALAQGTEKARSEFLIAPVFVEFRRQTEGKISIFSGWELNVDVETGLTGRCDFLISGSPYQADMEAPIVVAVEAKQDDFNKGITQCTAEMIAAQIFNERRGNIKRPVYGCVTTGDAWRFLVLEEKKSIVDTTILDVNEDVERIIGILWAMTFNEINK